MSFKQIISLLVAVVSTTAGSAFASSADVPPDGKADDNILEALTELESQLSGMVVSSTKTAQRAAESPAVVTIVGANEIQEHGYTSLADVLRAVPGFFDIDDLVTHNIGVRGINGGAGASGNVIKVMIDGHPVDFRPTTGNFFGEELIPMAAVERVEIIRGPASALYGANAFLGVVNIVTKSGADIRSSATAQGNFIRKNPGYGGSLLLGGNSERVDVMLAAGYSLYNRSGLSLPPSSPVLNTPAGEATYAARGPSQNDLARPKSFYGKVVVRPTDRSTLTATGSVQNLDSTAEFQDFGTLLHDSRTALLNQNYRLVFDHQVSDSVGLQFAAYYLNAATAAPDQVDTGVPNSVLKPNVGTSGFGFSAETRAQVNDKVSVTGGADAMQDDHRLLTYDTLLTQDLIAPGGAVLRTAGTLIPGPAHNARRTFRNLGVYAQSIYAFAPGWSATAGARVDFHSIYGINPSARVGLVYSPAERPYSVKLLYGSAFKAPSAVQLYKQPLAVGDTIGNPNLHTQNAHTIEVAGGYILPKEFGEITLNVFATDLLGRVEFRPRGLFLQAQNLADQWMVGGELDSRIRVARSLLLRAAAGLAYSVARSTNAAIVSGPLDIAQPSFPSVQVHLGGDYGLPWAGLHLVGELSYVGQRNTSQSNAIANLGPYTYSPYLYTALALSTAGRKIFGQTETSAALRVSNLANQIWVNPGFNGVDLPAQGRTILLTVTQSL